MALWFGPADYTYAGVRHPANNKWPKIVTDIMDKVNMSSSEHFNSALLNLYPTGEVGLPYHSDDEEIFDLKCIVGVSFGSARNINFRIKKNRVVKSLILENGSFYKMTGQKFQNTIEHEIPRSCTKDPRISITFRKIKAEHLSTPIS